jgi:hypothetical protein
VHRQKVDAAAAEGDESNEAGGAVEAERAPRDRANLAIESFAASARQTGCDVGDDALDVLLDGAGDLAEGWQLRAVCPSDPIEQLVASDVSVRPWACASPRLVVLDCVPLEGGDATEPG